MTAPIRTSSGEFVLIPRLFVTAKAIPAAEAGDDLFEKSDG